MELMVYVQSWLNITNHSVATTLHDIKHLKVAIYHIKIKDTFHGQLVQLLGWKIVFRFPESTIDQLQNYTITISNELDSADYVTELKSKVTIAPAINFQTPEGNFGESAHYTEIVEIDNLQPTSQENDNSILSMINSDIDVVPGEPTSTSSDNDSDSSEYLDDGYEKPYTTLVVAEDGHVYLTTKQKSDHANVLIPFQNVACGHACEILEEDLLSDETNAHDEQENYNLKNDSNATIENAPTIDIRYSPYERKMKCIPKGVPDRYIFKDWEHSTEYNDHIWFLATTKEGNTATLTFPSNVTGKNHQRDRGIYICRASNNISLTDGRFVMRKYNLDLKSESALLVYTYGEPYFVSSTENTQFGVYLKTAEIKIKFGSVPEYNSFDVNKNGSRFIDFTESVYRNKKLTDTIYGKNVSVKGIIISLQIQIDSLDAYSSYKIVVKIAIGSSHHTIELVSANKYAIVETSLSVQSVVILLSVVIIVLLVAGMGLYVRRLKQRHRERMELAINVGTTNGTYDEIAHYTDIIEIDTLQPTSQEQTSTSSENDRDSSEYLDDGYEKLYTTLEVTDQVKDEHDYLITIKVSNYENSISFQNVACVHACENLEEYSQSDKTNAHNEQENGNLNYDVNDINETNENVP
ncbi:unnamed protein product [Mytilus edulis]|uniref:Ig-like domain-containing protein n=1 Tax=Mytilus edulis TaxID=6550 RepID=A0A8S3TBF4_MYTED|nr:unnamed protein product [Mytilus edulis]